MALPINPLAAGSPYARRAATKTTMRHAAIHFDLALAPVVSRTYDKACQGHLQLLVAVPIITISLKPFPPLFSTPPLGTRHRSPCISCCGPVIDEDLRVDVSGLDVSVDTHPHTLLPHPKFDTITEWTNINPVKTTNLFDG